MSVMIFNHTIVKEPYSEHVMLGIQFIRYTRPMVYVWKRGSQYLYVGCSTRGITRLFNGRHETLKRDKVQAKDTIAMIFCYDTNEMYSLEFKLIRKHQPTYNKAYKS